MDDKPEDKDQNPQDDSNQEEQTNQEVTPVDSKPDEDVDDYDLPEKPDAGDGPHKPRPGRNLLKGRILFLVFFVLLIGSVVLYAISVNRTDSEANDSNQSDNSQQLDNRTSKDVLSIIMDGKLTYVDDTYNLSSSGQDINVPDDAYYSNQWAQGPLLRSATGNVYLLQNMQLKASLSEFIASVDSPDGLTTAYFEKGDDYPIESYVTIDNVGDDVQPQRLIESWNDEHGPLVPIAWRDDSTILLEEYSCFECDGPLLPRLYSLDVETKQLTLLVDLEEEGEEFPGYTQIYVRPDTSGVVFYNSGATLLPDPTAPTPPGEFFYYDLASDDYELVYKKDSATSDFTDIVGWGADGSSFIALEVENTIDDDEVTTMNFKGMRVVNVETKKTTFYPLQISDLSTDGNYPRGDIAQATVDEGGLYFITVTPRDLRTAQNDSYSLKVLPLTGAEESVVNIATSSKPILLFGFETITTEN